jgi:hypothetical protein
MLFCEVRLGPTAFAPFAGRGEQIRGDDCASRPLLAPPWLRPEGNALLHATRAGGRVFAFEAEFEDDALKGSAVGFC